MKRENTVENKNYDWDNMVQEQKIFTFYAEL